MVLMAQVEFHIGIYFYENSVTPIIPIPINLVTPSSRYFSSQRTPCAALQDPAVLVTTPVTTVVLTTTLVAVRVTVVSAGPLVIKQLHAELICFGPPRSSVIARPPPGSPSEIPN